MAIYTSDNNNPFNDTTTGLTALDATSVLSIACWVKAFKASFPTYDVFYHRQNGTTADGYALFYDSGSGGFNLRVYTAAVATDHAFGQIRGLSPGSGKWFHIAATLDGTSARLYFNGLGVARIPQAANATIAGVRRTIIGGVNVAGVGGVTLALADLRVWSGYALASGDVPFVAKGRVLGNENARWFVGNSGSRDLSKSGSHAPNFSTATVYPDPDYRSLVGPPATRTTFRSVEVGAGDGTYNRGMSLGLGIGVSS